MRLWVSPFLISSYILRHQHDVPSSVIKGCNIRSFWFLSLTNPEHFSCPANYVLTVWILMYHYEKMGHHQWECASTNLHSYFVSLLHWASAGLRVNCYGSNSKSSLDHWSQQSILNWLPFLWLVSSSFWLFCLIFSMYSNSHC